MSKCDCYRVESEIHCFVDENGVPIYESINVPRCLGTKEKDVCDCRGDKSKCNFYENDVMRIKSYDDEYEESVYIGKIVNGKFIPAFMITVDAGEYI